MKKKYEQVGLNFTIDRELIEGTLDGDYTYWTFTSQSPKFLEYVPRGVLQSSVGFKDPIPKEVHMLYKNIWTAAEAKGYSFDDG
jgi:hypothetical protein